MKSYMHLYAIAELALMVVIAVLLAQKPASPGLVVRSTLGDLSLTNEVPTVSEVETMLEGALMNSVPTNSLPDGVTFVDTDGIDQNVALSIGEGAVSGVSLDQVMNAPSGTVIRNGTVAIGAGAIVTNGSSPYKQQGTAIGWNAQAVGLNATAIGSGAIHTNETPMEGGSAYAKGDRAVAIGYGAKATEIGAVQIGIGTNSSPNSLKVGNTTIMENGKIKFENADLTAAVMHMNDIGVAKFTQHTPSPEGFASVQFESYDEDTEVDSVFKIMVNTNEQYKTVSIKLPETVTNVELYKKSTIDKMLEDLVTTGLTINGTNYTVHVTSTNAVTTN